jgi:hypothetical protein
MSSLLELLTRSPVVQGTDASDHPAPGATEAGFFAQGRLALDHLAVEVEGFGLLPQPLSPEQAQALQALSEPAHFGLREQTLLDTAVRHSGEIDADRLGLHWQPGTFAELQMQVAQALGVRRLDAWLHNLLIYGPGQFFKPHQDTERHPGMVATLVLVWPSPHIGGELRVVLGDGEGRLTSQHLQARDLRWFAFYADCRHEVLPVEEGWRVVLTFDLVMPTEAAGSDLPAARQTELQEALRQAMGLDDDSPRLAPWVLLLDHEYTEHGLRWPLLKGDDRWRVAALREAAEALGLRVHLALAELHETWTTEPVFRSRRGWSGRDYDEPTDEVEPDELIEELMSLDFWVDADGQVGPHRSLAIDPDDTLCFVDTGESHRTAEEYEGYMGNYGDTLDYWYRRAALVIRTPLADERDRFTLDFDAALAEAREMAADPACSAELAARVQAAASVLADQAARQGRSLLAAYTDIALALPDAEAAVALLQAFDPTTFEAEDAEPLARLARRHGDDRLIGLLQTWYAVADRPWQRPGPWRPGTSCLEPPRLWPQALPNFVAAAQAAGWSRQSLDALFDAGLALLVRFHQATHSTTPTQQQHLQAGLIAAAEPLAQALQQRGADGEVQLQRLIDELLAQPALYPLTQLGPIVQASGALAQQWPQAQPLREQVRAGLQQALAEPPRAADDHRLRGIPWTCRCRDCAEMITWAESPGAHPLVLAMGEPRRQHVQAKFTDAGVPLSAQTLKQGSPHKLVLGKPRDLHERERGLREKWAQDLAQLEGG